ncbi:MAG: hypothetical protein M3162_04445 [Thermoproteota archaeon]|nr:hypothetical protein [Thermoproteota archaeon]
MYHDNADNALLQKDETFARINKRLESLMANLSPEDKTMATDMVMECYLKYQKAIQSNSEGDHLMASLMIALLTEQNKRIEVLKK